MAEKKEKQYGYLELVAEAIIVAVPNAHKRRSNKCIRRSQFVIYF